MRRMLVLPLAFLALAGCVPDTITIKGLEAWELEAAYDRCLGLENHNDFDKRLACTAAVYGGDTP